MLALMEAGVPVVSVTGRGYSLMDGYFLPPLNFNTDEALMLILGADFMSQNFDAQYQQAARSAAMKIEAVLPDHLKADIDYLKTNIAFYSRPTDAQENGFLHKVRQAIIDRKTLRMCYAKRFPTQYEPELTEREVDPYSIARLANSWFLLGYCHLRHDIRIFRLDRVEEMAVLNKAFERPENYQPQWNGSKERRQIVVKALFDYEIARWVRETYPYSMVEEVEAEEGLLVTFRIERDGEIVNWLLGWGGKARVLEPESLRERLIIEARRLLENYGAC
jgi:predicted DNA-binding transcriptional regulator YafY